MILTSFNDMNQKILTKKKIFSKISGDFDFTLTSYDYALLHCSTDFCVKLSLVDKTT